MAVKDRPGKQREKNDFEEALDMIKGSSFESVRSQAGQWGSSSDKDESARLAKTENLKYFLDDAKAVVGPLVGVFDYIQQQRERKQAMRVADESMRQQPKQPGVRGENRTLSNLIRDASIAYSNPSQMVQPYLDQVNLGYQQDLARNREASGGQASVMGGMDQAAAIRRNRDAAQIAPMMSDVYKQGVELQGGLVGQQMQDDTWRDQQNIDLYKTDSLFNRQFQEQAGQALASSRAREIQSRNNVLDQLLDSPVFDVNTYMNNNRNNLINPPKI